MSGIEIVKIEGEGYGRVNCKTGINLVSGNDSSDLGGKRQAHRDGNISLRGGNISHLILGN